MVGEIVVESFQINKAKKEDYESIKQLLDAHNLPTNDMGESDINFLVLRVNQHLIGCAGLELFGTDALIRSVAVKKEELGKGFGSSLISYAMQEAVDAGISNVYLLTETAELFFKMKGFSVMPREDAPNSIKESTEFSHLCPDTALLMHKKS